MTPESRYNLRVHVNRVHAMFEITLTDRIFIVMVIIMVCTAPFAFLAIIAMAVKYIFF